ncbi:MAG: flotillin family protein [Candidatus Cloacimonetes bacterium]|nr:flotillin family protein [Candidatus Cloacimonadota bacterium]
MSGSALGSAVFIAGVVLAAIIAIGIIVSKLYTKASKELSFVRTGFGGQSVILDGGSLVFPVLHDVIPVNMNTLRLEVVRSNGQALITKDRMRVDVTAEFFVRVKPTREAIADAAQTLGTKTTTPQMLKDLVEGKFVDALRSVAAEMAMEELHEQRGSFVQKVQHAVSEDILKNGLELESVSLTGLDQTSREFFNPENAFDAQGLTLLTQQIETRRKQRNDITQETEVLIKTKNLESEKQQLEIRREEEYARLEQEREIEIKKANQASLIATEKANRSREAEEAEITAKLEVDKAKIEAEKLSTEKQIAKEQALEQKSIEKMQALEQAEIIRKKSIELSEQERAIAIAEKSKAQSEAEAEASKAKAEAVRENEKVQTVKVLEIAERQKSSELVEARKIAEIQAIEITVAAQAEKQASEDKALSVRVIAQAEADAEKLRSEGILKLKEAEAKGIEAVNNAEMILSPDLIQMKLKLALIENVSGIIEQSVKPMEQIDKINIMHVEGLGGSNQSNNTKDGATNLADEVVNSALRYRAQSPLVDSLLSELGMNGASLNGLSASVNSVPPPQTESTTGVDA